MLRYVIASLVCGLSASFATAEIPAETIHAYNGAMQSGDGDAIRAAARRLATDAIADPDDPQAAITAYEAANQLCIRQACADALDAARFAAVQGLEGTVPDEQVALLTAYSAWSSKITAETQAAFDAALEGIGDSEPTLLSVVAFESRYVHELAHGEPETVHKVSVAAAAHMQPARDIIVRNWATAQMVSITSAFNIDQDPETMRQMGDLNWWLKGQGNLTDPAPGWLDDLYYQTRAWTNAISAYLRSGDNSGRRADEIDAYLSARAEAEDNAEAETDHEKPFCKGNVVRPPRPVFPRNAAMRGYVGAVLVGFSINEGDIENVRILAAVPDNTFDEVALKAVRPLKWRFDKDQPVEDCTHSKETVIYPFEFVLN